MGTKELTKQKTTTPTTTQKYLVKCIVKSTYATTIRENLPIIYDKVEASVVWLAARYKVEDIELVGDKPSNWNAAFGIEEPKLTIEEIVIPDALVAVTV